MLEFLGMFISILSRVLFFAILGRVILSFIDPQGNMWVSKLLYELTEPLLGPIRRIVPPMGMLDFSPLILLLLLQFLQRLTI